MSNQRNSKNSNRLNTPLPPIPDKIYFAIGEVGRLCRLKPHVLRYWEQEFNQLSPSKRRGNRRYYQHKDVLLVRKIRQLLYDEGYTIEGARQQLQSIPPSDKPNETRYNALRLAVEELENIVAGLK
ncbi:MAG: transcriptional regulator [Coxiella sp. RIFCSPHIGHO2_12_FULL_42_15]|nr:MAG: transcriptional regulator [Coxiella sp. RIFCSPHIGHO2_12_FULL_42_15]